MNKLMGMRVFSFVARHGSYSEAAKKLSISKAMASKHVSNLESMLGVRLLNRTTRKLNLTEAGNVYYEKIDTILRDIDEAENTIMQFNSKPRGRLKIMAQPSFGAFHLSRVVSGYLDIYPEVTVEIELSHRAPNLVEDGIDLAFHVGELHDSMYIARKIASTRHIICAAPRYIAQYGEPNKPADLINHNCLTYTPLGVRQKWLFNSQNKATTDCIISGTMQCNDGDALRVAAIQGSGIIQLPSYVIGLDVQSGRLKALLEDYEPERLPIFAIYSHRKFLSAKIQSFVEYIFKLYQPEAYWNEWT